MVVGRESCMEPNVCLGMEQGYQKRIHSNRTITLYFKLIFFINFFIIWIPLVKILTPQCLFFLIIITIIHKIIEYSETTWPSQRSFAFLVKTVKKLLFRLYENLWRRIIHLQSANTELDSSMYNAQNLLVVWYKSRGWLIPTSSISFSTRRMINSVSTYPSSRGWLKTLNLPEDGGGAQTLERASLCQSATSSVFDLASLAFENCWKIACWVLQIVQFLLSHLKFPCLKVSSGLQHKLLSPVSTKIKKKTQLY